VGWRLDRNAYPKSHDYTARGGRGGLLAGAVGTVALDTVQYARHRRAGGKESPLAWEFAPVDSWEKAPAPGRVAKRLVEGLTQRKLPDRWAWLTSTCGHSVAGAWLYLSQGSTVLTATPTKQAERNSPHYARRVLSAQRCLDG
jgi:hypothetical protein